MAAIIRTPPRHHPVLRAGGPALTRDCTGCQNASCWDRAVGPCVCVHRHLIAMRQAAPAGTAQIRLDDLSSLSPSCVPGTPW